MVQLLTQMLGRWHQLDLEETIERGGQGIQLWHALKTQKQTRGHIWRIPIHWTHYEKSSEEDTGRKKRLVDRYKFLSEISAKKIEDFNLIYGNQPLNTIQRYQSLDRSMDEIATFLESWESCFKQLFTFYDKYQRSSRTEKLTRDNEMMRKTTKQIGDLFERARECAEKTKGKAINSDLHEHPQQLVSSFSMLTSWMDLIVIWSELGQDPIDPMVGVNSTTTTNH